MLARYGPVAYKLHLPQGSRIHPTFHVSLLKPFIGQPPELSYPLPEITIANKPVLMPTTIVAVRTQTVNNEHVRQVLVQWAASPPEEATWENFDVFCKIYNATNLANKVVFDEGSNDSPVQMDSPITIDGDSAHKQVTRWIEEAQGKESAQMGDNNNQENTGNVERETTLAEAGPERRKRVRPRWLADFVLAESR